MDVAIEFLGDVADLISGVDSGGHPFIGVVLTVVVAILSLVLVRIVQIIGRRLEKRFGEGADRFRGFQLQQQDILSGEDVSAFLVLVVTGLRLLMGLTIILAASVFCCQLFPWSRHIVDAVIDVVGELLLEVGQAIAGYIPNLFVIAIVGALLWYAIRLVHLVFLGIGSERIRVRGFYPEWAIPTFNIVKLLMIVFGLVVAFPYLPGAKSPAFRGISIFIGVLVSLGSTSAVGNVVAGVVLIYMRAFKLGDRVRIANVEGIVIERSLFVTRLRTPKNVEVAIPNAKVMADGITNFNAQVKKKGLIHHTTLSIGYDVEWRRVRDLLIAAAQGTDGVVEEPKPFVRQLELGDFSVVYELNVTIRQAHQIQKITSDLHANILDAFNEAGVEIMSPEFSALRDGNAVTIPGYSETGSDSENDA